MLCLEFGCILEVFSTLLVDFEISSFKCGGESPDMLCFPLQGYGILPVKLTVILIADRCLSESRSLCVCMLSKRQHCFSSSFLSHIAVNLGHIVSQCAMFAVLNFFGSHSCLSLWNEHPSVHQYKLLENKLLPKLLAVIVKQREGFSLRILVQIPVQLGGIFPSFHSY